MRHTKLLQPVGLAIIFISLGVFAGSAAYVWQRTHDNSKADNKETSQASKPGWKVFCSDYGYACLEYPESWKLKTSTTKDEAVSPETTSITSPSGDVVVRYRPNYGVTEKTEADILTVIGVDTTKLSDLKVVSMISQYNGGPLAEKPFAPMTFVTDTLQAATGDAFTPGAVITSDNEPVYHTFTPGNNQKVTSYLYVKYDQKNSYPNSAGLFYSYDQALAALESAEAKTAREILQTVSYKKS